MKFVIEGLGLTAGGGKTGLLRLLPALADRGRRHTFVAVLASLEEFRTLERPNLQLVLKKKPASLLRRHFHLHTVSRICADERADALLCLGNFGPRPARVPTVTFLHNAAYVYEVQPATVWANLRERLIARYARNYLRRLPEDTHLVVQTEVMKRRVVAAFGLPASRVTIIGDGEGLPPISAGPGPAASAAASSARLKPGESSARSHCIDRTAACAPFTFLCVARYYPHKNLEVLLEAMKRLRAHSCRPARCLITIHANQHPAAGRLLRRIAFEGLQEWMINIGPLDGNAVVEAYRAADAFILPSLLESFGRTYLEAVRFDLPIVTSDRDFAHEVCSGAALYVDPLDPESVARGMARIMNNGELRQQLAAERRRIRISSWEEIAARFVDILERAAARSELPRLVVGRARCIAPAPDTPIHRQYP